MENRLRKLRYLGSFAAHLSRARIFAPKKVEETISHWIGLRENLQETMVFTIKYRAFL
jgi:hypothetical protein